MVTCIIALPLLKSIHFLITSGLIESSIIGRKYDNILS